MQIECIKVSRRKFLEQYLKKFVKNHNKKFIGYVEDSHKSESHFEGKSIFTKLE